MKTIFFFLIITFSTLLFSTVIHVPAEQPTIQAGIDATVDADTVLVQPGTYVENINFNGKLITVASLFLTTQDTTYISQTVIDGNQNGSVVRFETGEDSTAVLTGFKITNGCGSGYPDFAGGGITCINSSPSMLNILVSENNADSGRGGGIYCYLSNPNLENVIINTNISEYGNGGGICCYESSPILTNVTITDNSATHGGGIYFSSNTSSLIDVIITGNFASYRGGGICCNSSSPNLENVTISANSSIHAGGIHCSLNSHPSLINCILWNDSPYEINFSENNPPNSITISYSDIQGGEVGIVTNNNGTVNWLDGNIDVDPLFADSLTGDFHLTENSPCIDAGDPALPLDPDGTIADMGAFYYHHTISNIINIPADYPTIQEGINAAAIGDIVLVQPGTYFENINYNGKNITVASLFLTTQDTTYISQTIIDGDSLDTVVIFENGEDSTTVLCGFTITNGFASGSYFANSGGGIYCYDSSPSMINITISNNVATYGGGCNFSHNSNPCLFNVKISSNSGYNGGGIYCSNSSPSLGYVKITSNSATPGGHGGGIYCSDGSNPDLKNIIITDNSADHGGGIYCSYNSSLSLENVTISGNSAGNGGGGIYCSYNSSLNFDTVARCNIYLNSAGSGCDLYAHNCGNIDVVVDTFTVSQPDDYFAYPTENFTFDIHNAKVEQVSQDLYVSPAGSDENSGLTIDDPLLSVSFALVKIFSESTNPLTIHLSNGIYSPSGTGEIFPLFCRSYASLHGESEDSTILDGEELSKILYCREDNNFSIMNMTIKNGCSVQESTQHGGGIYCDNSNPSLMNVTITGNSAGGHGGGIYCEYSSPILENVIITGNSGGGIYCYNGSNPNLNNVSITGNSGRGIYCEYSSPSLENVIITGNSGGGIYCYDGSDPNLKNVSITDNSAMFGGGIYCYYSSPSLENVIISGNSASWSGGGLYCGDSSNPNLQNVTLKTNTASESGGGISIFGVDSNLNFDSSNRCSIYSNTIENNRGAGADIFFFEFYEHDIMHIIVDTFTVMTPTDYYASPIDKFTFDILHCVQDGLVNCDVYVSVDGDDSNSGLNHELPFKTINHALKRIYTDSLNINTIHLAEGIYSPSTNGEIFPIHWSNYVNLTGDDQETTILDANNTSSVMKFNVITYANINNITIRNGDAAYGGGISCDESSISLENMTISGNSASYGGGIYCWNSNPSLENVTIKGNTAYEGGGIFDTKAYITRQKLNVLDKDEYKTSEFYFQGVHLENVTITDNLANTGGGICCYDSWASIINVEITDNTASDEGGGIYCFYSNLSLENVIISGNSAISGGGLYYYGYSYFQNPNLQNVTISDNSAEIGGGIYLDDSDTIIVNSIFWNDSPEEIFIQSGSATFTYSDIQGGWTGTGNIDEDPLFVNPLTGDYHLTEYSPCIDAGDPASPLDPDGTIADMGAFYFHQAVPNSPQNLTINITGNNVHLSWDAVTGANSYKVYSSDEPYIGFIEDTSGSFVGESWSTSIINEKKFYYVIASTEIIRFKNSY